MVILYYLDLRKYGFWEVGVLCYFFVFLFGVVCKG